ncbi:ComEA family DNA-binding protein [Trinickia acidisoli]|uniref:ComEA family DNA-binding protein n=1 Tax=Trinickia acidisoli TaxID=2767482 RepID=UPI001A8CDD8B|nr:helix-hairpin-helix domain-containing protein [Trinickia acidisoli]
MFKRFVLLAAVLIAAFPAFFAHAVDVNTADEAALRGIKGIGPAKAKAIVDERAAGGLFKDADDLGQRVKGLGGQAIERLEAEGLTVGAVRHTVPSRPSTVVVGPKPLAPIEPFPGMSARSS